MVIGVTLPVCFDATVEETGNEQEECTHEGMARQRR
jgi:hypothetical protein